MKVKTIQPEIEINTKKINHHKKDAFWYYDDEIANLIFEGKHYVVLARGEIGVTFLDGDKFFKGQSAVDEAIRRGYGDKRITNKLHWSNNNWFEIFSVDEFNNINELSFDDGIAYDYDNAIELAKELIQVKL